MASSTLLERGSSAVAPFSSPIQGFQPGSLPAGSPASANWCVLPRCSVEFEKTFERLQDSLPLRRRSRPRHVAESVPHAGRRNVQLLLHAERHSVLPN